MPKRALRQPPCIDLETLLHGDPSWDQVVEFFRSGEFCDEPYLVEAIEKHLLTDPQRNKIFNARLSIEKMLNGRYTVDHEEMLEGIYKEWNGKLGFKCFGDS
jgi:hypothetical protein